MDLRIVKVDEFQFLTCFKYGLWGSHVDRLNKWQAGDYLVFIVDKQLAALAQASGDSFKSEEIVWDNGLYPYRTRINFIHILSQENRIPVLGEVRDVLIGVWGQSYGWGILNQQVLPENAAGIIVSKIKEQPNGLDYYIKNLENLLEEAKRQREFTISRKKRNRQREKGVSKKSASKTKSRKTSKNISNANEHESHEGTMHSKAQYLLIDIGKAADCTVWVASNDRNRKYQGELLGKFCIERFPKCGLEKQALEKILLIDVIWIQQNAPICAFEVETTTSIYSGLLRMSDLLALVPVLKIKLFIIAPKERQNKVMQELNRPTFRKIGLNEYCRFISIEDLEKLSDQVKDLSGCIKPAVLDKIAVEADTYDEEEVY